MGSAAATPGGCERWDGKAQALPAFGSSRLSPWSLRQYGGKKEKIKRRGRRPRAPPPTPTSAAPKKNGREGKKKAVGANGGGARKEKCGGTPKQDVTASRRLKRLPSSAAIGACGARPGARKRKPARAAPAFQGGDAKRKDWVGSNPPVYPWVRGDASDVKLHDFLLIQVVELRVTLARREL